MQGFELYLKLDAIHKEAGKVNLGLFAYCQDISSSSCPAQLPVALSFTLCAQKASSGGQYSHQSSDVTCLKPASGWGWADFFRKSMITEASALSEFMVDGKLKLRGTLLKLDGQQIEQQPPQQPPQQ